MREFPDGARERCSLVAARWIRCRTVRPTARSSPPNGASCRIRWPVRGVVASPGAVLLGVGQHYSARLAWACAAHLDPQCDAAKYLEDLSHGFVAAALRRYNRAIEAARRGQWSDALRQLQPVRRSLPDFLPAGRLSGLVLESSGDAEAAR